jgi:hypothetical protein
LHSFRHAETILKEPAYLEQYNDLLSAISAISEEDIITHFLNTSRSTKSVSDSINQLLKIEFTRRGWLAEPKIFKDENYSNDTWRLDFAKDDISIEVAFNHSGSIAWNLIKPVLASELNHVPKQIQTRIGVVICATNELRSPGGFDSAIGTFEKFIAYLAPMQNLLVTPLLLIGLSKFETFEIVQNKQLNGRYKGDISMIYNKD